MFSVADDDYFFDRRAEAVVGLAVAQRLQAFFFYCFQGRVAHVVVDTLEAGSEDQALLLLIRHLSPVLYNVLRLVLKRIGHVLL